MGNRRFAQVSTSDEDEDGPPPSSRTRKSEEKKEPQSLRQSKRKRIKLQEEEDDEEPEEERKASKRERRDKGKVKEAEKPRNDGVEDEEEEEEEEQPQEDAKPVGEPVRFSGKGRGRRSHYEAFEFDGNKYELEDPVLLTPEDTNQKPYVAIIKDITQSKDGSMMVTGQWFYRPEEADRKGGGNWLSRDTRELFYSFHRDEVPAESVMHKCVVHFVPIHKQLPNRKQHPGFIVQKVYDTVERKLWKLTDKDYEDNKQHEIDLLVQKTRARLGDLPDIEPEETAAREQEDQLKAKRTLRKKNISPLDVSREEDSTTRSDQYVKAETPGSCTSNASEYHNILSKFKALTGETHRDKWLERLLQGLQYMCNSGDSIHADQNGKGGCAGVDHKSEDKSAGTENGSREKGQKNGKSFIWPDTAIAAVTALEKASHDALSSDFQKYNQKLRQLSFNLKSTALLARRLLNGELEPSKILNMSPNELKEGLTAEETAKKEPDESEQMQMTDARCSRCNECKVGLRDIIQAGHGDRCQLLNQISKQRNMGKSGRDRRASNLTSVSHKSLSLREEKAGKKQVNITNVKSKLKLEHLQRLAVWASNETSASSLAALFGHCLASANEALGLQLDPSLFSCQRCETVLQPGFNCTIRLEKNQVKSRRRRKNPKTSMQNRVVYKCHFCSHHNHKRGTPRGHVKEICTLKAKPSLKPECGNKSPLERSANTSKDTRNEDEVSKVDDVALPAISKDSAVTPPVKSRITLESKKRRRKPGNKKNSAESESNSATTDDKTVGVSSRRRRRTSWTSLKEIAEQSEDNGGNANLLVPFSL